MAPPGQRNAMKNKKTSKYLLFAACAPGLEPYVAQELKALSAGNIQVDDRNAGGVSFTGTRETIIRANLQLRIADRVLLRLAEFSAKHLADLGDHAAAIPFDTLISPSTSVFISATCKKSKIYHSGAACDRVAKVIGQQIQLTEHPQCQMAPPEAAQKFAAIQIRLIHDMATISLDTSGVHLHKRGYRSHVTQAPMRETIAAAALKFCGYDGSAPLVDPMCGSGTFLAEAALMATRSAPGLHRSFGFEHWPNFNRDQLDAEKERAVKFAKPFAGTIIGCDKNATAVTAANNNIRSAQMSTVVNIETKDIADVTLPESDTPGLIICNPPWGKRLKDNEDTSRLYKRLGDLAQQRSGWKLCVITSSAQLAKASGVKFTKVSDAVPVGGVRVKFYLG